MRHGLLLLALAGCGAGNVVTEAEQEATYFATGRAEVSGRVPVRVFGAPPEGLSSAEAVALLDAPAAYEGLVFAPAAPGPAPGGWSFVLAFGTDRAAFLCERPAPGGDPSLVAAALCLDDRTVSRAALRFGPGGFRAALPDLLVSVLPAYRRRTNDSPG